MPADRVLARGADALVLLVDHRAYKDLDSQLLASRMRRRVLVDTRGGGRVRWTVTQALAAR